MMFAPKYFTGRYEEWSTEGEYGDPLCAYIKADKDAK